MARLHTKKRGKSGSRPPASKAPPMWLPVGSGEVVALVEKLAREGKPEAEIGQVLRDEYGIPNVKSAAGESISEILGKKGLKSAFPQDLLNLIKRAVKMRRHLNANPQDTSNQTRLARIESKIRRLTKYYSREGRIPKGWMYRPEQAALFVK